MLQPLRTEDLQPVLPGDPLPHLRDQVQVVDPAAVDLLLAPLLPAIGWLRLLEKRIQVRPGRARRQPHGSGGESKNRARDVSHRLAPFWTRSSYPHPFAGAAPVSLPLLSLRWDCGSGPRASSRSRAIAGVWTPGPHVGRRLSRQLSLPHADRESTLRQALRRSPRKITQNLSPTPLTLASALLFAAHLDARHPDRQTLIAAQHIQRRGVSDVERQAEVGVELEDRHTGELPTIHPHDHVVHPQIAARPGPFLSREQGCHAQRDPVRRKPALLPLFVAQPLAPDSHDR